MLARFLKLRAPRALCWPLCHQTNALCALPSSGSSPAAETRYESTLTQEDVNRINLLIPRLCLSSELRTAIRLIDAALLLQPPPRSLPFHILTRFLTALPEMTECMYLLNRLKFSPPAHPYLTFVGTLLIAAYLERRKCREALKVYTWMLRPDTPCQPEAKAYGVLVNGLCRHGLVREALQVFSAMMRAGYLPGNRLKTRVFRTLLWEARIGEAKELDDALHFVVKNESGDSKKKVLELLDSIIEKWTD